MCTRLENVPCHCSGRVRNVDRRTRHNSVISSTVYELWADEVSCERVPRPVLPNSDWLPVMSSVYVAGIRTHTDISTTTSLTIIMSGTTACHWVDVCAWICVPDLATSSGQSQWRHPHPEFQNGEGEWGLFKVYTCNRCFRCWYDHSIAEVNNWDHTVYLYCSFLVLVSISSFFSL